jgi:hypothetical protein
MNPRMISALIFAVIIAVEILLFSTQSEPTKLVNNPGGSGLFGSKKTVVDFEAQESKNIQYGMIVLGTAAIGAIVTFSIKQKKD